MTIFFVIMSKLFETAKIAEAYAKYRPTFGKDVFECIINYCKEIKCSFALAVDVGCGSGQSTVPLTKHFDKVIGVDISEKQISHAPKDIPNVTFRAGPAEDLSFIENETTDLVTVAQALHWMNLTKFYSEVERILKPGGSLVAYGYGINILDEPKAEDIKKYFYVDVLGPYWNKERYMVEEHYHSISLPFPGWHRNDTLKIERSWTVDELMGYWSSWSAWHNFLAENPQSRVLEDIRDRLKTIYGGGGDGTQERCVNVTWPVFMLMGHKPLP